MGRCGGEGVKVDVEVGEGRVFVIVVVLYFYFYWFEFGLGWVRLWRIENFGDLDKIWLYNREIMEN